MKIRPEQLKSHLLKDLLPVYVVSGDEPLLAQESADAVRHEARKQGFSGREVFHGDGNFDWGSLHNEANALSLFAEKKIIELRLPMASLATKVAKLCVSSAPTLIQIICY